MYSLIAGACAGVLIAVLFRLPSRKGINCDFVPAAIGAAFAGLILGFVGGLAINGRLPSKSESDTYKLASMTAVNSVDGVYVWGSGNISTSMKYSCLVVLDDGRLEPWSPPAYATIYLREQENLKNEGRMVIRWKHTDTSGPLGPWAIDIRGNHDYTYEFQVPVGSVKYQFVAN